MMEKVKTFSTDISTNCMTPQGTRSLKAKNIKRQSERQTKRLKIWRWQLSGLALRKELSSKPIRSLPMEPGWP